MRLASRKDLDIIIDWASKEGWNPGLHDADSFFAADPNGFFIGYLDGNPISSLSAVKYGDNFAFLGFYIVHPDYRGQGFGIKIWNHVLEQLGSRNIGLDGVLEQQSNYSKSGFKFAYKNVRYEGKVETNHDRRDSNIVPIERVSLKELLEYDSQVFPASRKVFLQEWVKQPGSIGLAYKEGSILRGYGVIRKYIEGYKVGPLFADNYKIAEILFDLLVKQSGNNFKIVVDVPEVNGLAIELAKSKGMKPVFETARMYSQGEPDILVDKVYGVTSFELG